MSDEAQTASVQCKEPGCEVFCCFIIPFCIYLYNLFNLYITAVNCSISISFINVSTIPELILRSLLFGCKRG